MNGDDADADDGNVLLPLLAYVCGVVLCRPFFLGAWDERRR